MPIPQYKPIYNRKKIAERVKDYILNENNFFSEYEETRKFEENITKFLNVKHCITCNNGTMALALALLANGIKARDYVLIPNCTMMSTQASVELIGAIPVFVDVDENGCMDLQKAQDILLEYCEDSNHGTSVAVIYVTLNGRTHDNDKYVPFREYCKNHNISLIEDNCQSFGSKDDYTDYQSASANNIGCFSLSYHKLLSNGQGGFCVTNNDDLALKLRKLKNVGRLGAGDHHEDWGINNKFTDIQAIIGNAELEDIEEKINIKKRLFSWYREKLNDVKEVSFIPTDLIYCTPWMVDIYCENRNELMEFLEVNNVKTRKIYPQLSSQPINKKYNLNNEDYPVSKQFAEKGFWLPSSLDLTENQINDICDMIKVFYRYKQTLGAINGF